MGGTSDAQLGCGAGPGGGGALAAQVGSGRYFRAKLEGNPSVQAVWELIAACHGSNAELHRRRVPEYGHRQERRPALASAQVLWPDWVRETEAVR